MAVALWKPATLKAVVKAGASAGVVAMAMTETIKPRSLRNFLKASGVMVSPIDVALPVRAQARTQLKIHTRIKLSIFLRVNERWYIIPPGGYLRMFLRLIILWDVEKCGYRLRNLTRYGIFSVRSSKILDIMKNLLNLLVNRRKKSPRLSRSIARNANIAQISKMGLLGQSLVIMSK